MQRNIEISTHQNYAKVLVIQNRLCYNQFKEKRKTQDLYGAYEKLYMEMVEHCTEGSCIFFVQPFHRSRSLQTPTIRRLRAFSMPKLSDWTRSKDTGFPWQNPPNAPIFVNIPTAIVCYIIKKASANFGKRTVLYRVPRMGLVEKINASFLFNLVGLIKTDDLLDCGCRV